MWFWVMYWLLFIFIRVQWPVDLVEERNYYADYLTHAVENDHQDENDTKDDAEDSEEEQDDLDTDLESDDDDDDDHTNDDDHTDDDDDENDDDNNKNQANPNTSESDNTFVIVDETSHAFYTNGYSLQDDSALYNSVTCCRN